MKRYYILPEAFSASREISQGLHFIPSLHLCSKAILILVDNLFDVLLNSVCMYFIQNISIRDFGLFFTWVSGVCKTGLLKLFENAFSGD